MMAASPAVSGVWDVRAVSFSSAAAAPGAAPAASPLATAFRGAAAPTVLDPVVKGTSGSGGGCPRRGPRVPRTALSRRSRRLRRIAGSVTAAAAPGAAAAAPRTRRSQRRPRSPGHFPARWETTGQVPCCQACLSPLEERAMPVEEGEHPRSQGRDWFIPVGCSSPPRARKAHGSRLLERCVCVLAPDPVVSELKPFPGGTEVKSC